MLMMSLGSRLHRFLDIYDPTKRLLKDLELLPATTKQLKRTTGAGPNQFQLFK